MDTAYQNLVQLQPSGPPLIPFSNARQSLTHEWQATHQPQLFSAVDASPVHGQIPRTNLNHVGYATPTPPQHSYMSHHIPDNSTNLPSSSSADPGPSNQPQPLSFNSPQIESSIGPNRSLTRRRNRMQRVVSHGHGELPDWDYELISIPRPHAPPPLKDTPYAQDSRPHSPATQPVYQSPDQTQHTNMNADTYNERMDGQPEWRSFPPNQSRSVSGSTASASSNPRSASPALSVASALTSISSASNSNLYSVSVNPTEKLIGTRRDRKKRLYNTDRHDICLYAQQHPGTKQEDIAAHFGVERSTVSKILKQRNRWLSICPEKILVAKLRPSKFPELEHRLADWVKKASKEGKVLTDALLRKKAREFGDTMGFTEDKFKASSGWLENFKHRHGIRRGVWYGHGTLEAKHRAYAMDLISDVVHPFPDTPPPIREDSSYNDPVDTDDEAGSPMHATAEQENIRPVRPLSPPLSLGHLTQSWSQSVEPASSHAGSSSNVHAYGQSSPQLGYPSYDDPAHSSAPGPATGTSSDSNAHVSDFPFPPEGVEMVEPIGEISDHEAERCINKLCYYLKTRDDLGLEPEVWASLVHVQSKIFGLISGRPYDQPLIQVRHKSS